MVEVQIGSKLYVFTASRMYKINRKKIVYSFLGLEINDYEKKKNDNISKKKKKNTQT